MVEHVEKAPKLAVLLARGRDELAASWVAAVRRVPGSGYCDLPTPELYDSAERALTAIVEALTTGSDDVLEDYLHDVSQRRLDQRFDIGEVIEGFLLLREAALPLVWGVFAPGAVEGYEAAAQLDGCVRRMLARFSRLYAAAMQRDVVEHHKRAEALATENARLYEEASRRLAESEGLQRVAAALLEKLDLGEVLDVVCAEARQLTEAGGSAVFLREEGEWLRVARRTGTDWPRYDRLPMGRSLTGTVVQTGRARLTNSPALEPERFRGEIVPTALLAVPLRVKGVVIGALDVINKLGGFSGEDLRVMGLFADQAAIAIENARLRRRVEQLAVVEERQRLARELHDSVTQSLYSMSLFAEAAGGLVASGNTARALDHLQQLRETAQESLREMRLLIFELHPPALEKEGLAAALQARLDSVEARAGVQYKLLVEGDERLAISVEEDLYRIALEALNNVLKHARAQRVMVSLRCTRQGTCLEVVDDGIGFDLSSGRGKGRLGISGMEERARRIGGVLTIRSRQGDGTTVRIEMPKPCNGLEGTGDGE